jgi:hypothetical protein
MDVSDLKLGDIRKIAELTKSEDTVGDIDLPSAMDFAARCESDEKFKGICCCVRTYAAGVHVGMIDQIIRYVGGVDLIMSDVRRIWKWSGAFTLSEVTQVGINPSGSRMSMVTPYQLICNVVEIIPVTPKAKATFDKTTNEGN